jgi:SNF2 family DNA or RNA helicase
MAKLISKEIETTVTHKAYDIEVEDNHNYFANGILVHNCKDVHSQQGKALMKLQPKVRIAMTGTPLMNSPLDLYAILKWLGYEKHAFYTFKNYYCIMGGYGGYEIVGYKHLEELESQLQSIMLRRLKKEVLDLPEKTYIDDYVDMLPKQSIVYKEVKAEIKSNIDMISISPNPLAEMIRLRQATGYTGILSSEIQCSAKLDRMEELVADSIANDEQVIVFSNWTQITQVAVEKLQYKCKLGTITGNTPDTDRQWIVDEFQDGNIDVLVATIGAAGTGLTLTAGTVVIFLDHPWSRALYEQAVDRAHRIGQTNNITIYNIMCKDTIDERIWELVKRKGELSDKIVDQDGKVMTNRDIANYLLS